jgi:hypothetical protein
MANKLYEEQYIQNIANSIRAKNGSNSTYTLSQMATAIDNIPTGNPTAESNDVNFIDYDGTIIYSYSASDFANLSALPNNPIHEGLIAQGWNWTLSDAKSYVASYKKLVIGQMYVTNDNKTRIYIELTEGRTSPYLGFAINGTATIGWGDGTTNTVTGTSEMAVINTQHNYLNAGKYTITIQSESHMIFMGTATTGSQVLWSTSSSSFPNRVYQNAIKRVELGSNVVLSSYSFCCANALESISIPMNVDVYGVGKNAFENAYSLKGLVISTGMTNLGDYLCQGCFSLLNVSLPKNLTTIKLYAFSNCYSLINISIPDTTTTVESYIFRNCYSLQNISFPNSITQFSEAMAWCFNCYALNKVMFGNFSLIPLCAFNNCCSISHFDCPSSVTAVNAQAFSGCYGIKYFNFSNHSSVPTLQNTNAFNNIPSDCQIIVPDSLYSTWIAATNWSTYASNIVKVSEAQIL